jgi:hypothetical protein
MDVDVESDASYPPVQQAILKASAARTDRRLARIGRYRHR